MRSSLLVVVLSLAVTACATAAQKQQCFPIASWSSPAFNCPAGEPPPKPAPEPVAAPEPTPEPEPEPPKVEVKEESIDLKEKVQFETGSAVLLAQSQTLLDEVAKTMNDHPEIKKVRIDGHTDGEASRSYNQKLSQKRAKAVKDYLISKGVAAKRLDSKGWGEDKPIADNKTPEGREQNRRVEIKILKRE